MRSATAYAPGRVELLGNHTDYNLGVVLAAAIDRGITIQGSVRDDGVISLTSPLDPNIVEIALKEFRPQEGPARWANYALGVVREFLDAGYKISGFDAEISGDLPIGAGLSSSAAFEVATAVFLAKLFDANIDALTVVRLCRKAENDFVGVKSGLLDQVTSVFGRASHLVYLDCKTEKVNAIPFPADLALVIANSGTKHNLLRSHYNKRREECAAAAQALGVSSLRDIAPDGLASQGATIDPVLFRRALHIVGENNRVRQAIDFLNAGNSASFGELMNLSHESSRVNFENSTEELDLLVSIAQSLPGVLGSRLTGGGFGGGTVTLASAATAPKIVDALNERYAESSGRSANAFICRIGDGAVREL